MKTLFVLLAITGYCLAAEAPYSPVGSKQQGALLLLPLKTSTNTTNATTTPRPTNNGDENLEQVNARILEQLAQQQGSEQGVYHVYLEDGRLQRIQYTTAPLSSAQQAQQSASANYYQQQTPEILSPDFADKRGVYFVQVPQERIRALMSKGQPATQQSSQGSQAFSSAQYNQQPSTPLNVRYVPLQESDLSSFGSSSQYREAEPTMKYVPVPLAGDSSSYQQQQFQKQQQQQQDSGYIASVQYSPVEPIQGPVYSYSPSSLTRILRYAPVY